jgi:hypothetical protein
LKMFPYDNDEFDEEERALNAQIKVCHKCRAAQKVANMSSEHHSLRRCWI